MRVGRDLRMFFSRSEMVAARIVLDAPALNGIEMIDGSVFVSSHAASAKSGKPCSASCSDAPGLTSSS